jgi:hypothetical protein
MAKKLSPGEATAMIIQQRLARAKAAKRPDQMVEAKKQLERITRRADDKPQR